MCHRLNKCLGPFISPLTFSKPQATSVDNTCEPSFFQDGYIMMLQIDSLDMDNVFKKLKDDFIIIGWPLLAFAQRVAKATQLSRRES